MRFIMDMAMANSAVMQRQTAVTGTRTKPNVTGVVEDTLQRIVGTKQQYAETVKRKDTWRENVETKTNM